MEGEFIVFFIGMLVNKPWKIYEQRKYQNRVGCASCESADDETPCADDLLAQAWYAKANKLSGASVERLKEINHGKRLHSPS